MTAGGVHELRLILTVDDFASALRLYRDALGMPEVPAVSSPEGRVAILRAGRATLELADASHAAWVDEVEVGERTAGAVRIALAVDDVDGASDRLVALGQLQLAPPTQTPFGSRNARFDGAGNVQMTLFTPTDGHDVRTDRG